MKIVSMPSLTRLKVQIAIKISAVLSPDAVFKRHDESITRAPCRPLTSNNAH